MQIRTRLKKAWRTVDPTQCRNSRCKRISKETRMAVTGATEVHRALCAPEWQRLGAFEIASRVVPARYVGGDFICCFRHDHKTFALLGDLMGKGLSAAMWVTHTVDLVRRAAEGASNVCVLLKQLNVEILNSRISAPLTSAIGLALDHRTGLISCSSAGHPPAIVLRAEGKAEVTTAGGPLLGAFACASYTCQNIELSAGDSVILFSDGLIEACNGEREEFTVERAIEVAGRPPSCTPADKVSRLLEATTAFAGETPLDDISIMVVQRN